MKAGQMLAGHILTLKNRISSFRLYGVLDNIAICPIAFNSFEELKAKVKWRSTV